MPAPNLPGIILDRAHPLAEGLVLWLPMNEAAGGATYDVVSGRKATLTNGPKWTGGSLGSAIQFDGSDDYLTIPHDSSLAILGDMSWFCFVRIASYTGDQILVSKSTTNWGNPYDARIHGTGPVYHCRGTAGGNLCKNSASSVPLGRWVHLGVTQKGSAVRFFMDGRLDSSDTLVYTPTDASGAFRLGVRVDNATKLNGQQAHVRIYNRALTDLEVSQLYTNPMAGAYWNEGNGLPVITGILAKTLASMTLSGSAVAPIFAALAKTLAGTTLLGRALARRKDRSVYHPGGGRGSGGRSTNIDHKGSRTVR